MSFVSESHSVIARECFRLYAAKNSDVAICPTVELLDVMNSEEERKRTILVDVRTAAERAVSYIPGSVSVDEFEAMNAEETKQKKVVCYCTIGLRSGNYCNELINKKGFDRSRVRNGEGVVLWTYEAQGKPLVTMKANGEEQTMRVHCFGEKWAKMLNTAGQGEGKYEPVVFSSFELVWYGIRAKLGFN